VWAVAGAVQIVATGKVKSLDFRVKDTIGTRQLRLCSVVVIASAYGAILAHIPPQPQPTINPISAYDKVRSMVNEVSRLYRNRQRYFLSAESVVSCAVFQGQVALPSQLDIIESTK
jgi:hypothetical protein